MLRRDVLGAGSLGLAGSLFASRPAKACASRIYPQPYVSRPYSERLTEQLQWREKASAVGLGRLVVQRDRAVGVFETVVSIKESSPEFAIYRRRLTTCERRVAPPELEVGLLAIMYFLPAEDTQFSSWPMPEIIALDWVVDPQVGPLLRDAATRLRASQR